MATLMPDPIQESSRESLLYAQHLAQWTRTWNDPLEQRLELVLQGATELTVIGSDHYYNRQNYEDARSAYKYATQCLLIPTSTHVIQAAYSDKFQELFRLLYLNLSVVCSALGLHAEAIESCSKSLLMKESAGAYLRRGHLCHPLFLHDFQAAKRLDETVISEAQYDINMVAAKYGTDAGGHVRYEWQQRWEGGGVPSELQGAMKKLLVQDTARSQVRWGELRAHPGPGSDLRWAELSDPVEATRNRYFIFFCEAVQMLLKSNNAWGDVWCGCEWLLELHSLGFQLKPDDALHAGHFLIKFCRGSLAGSAAKGFQLLNEAADGKHNHDLCAANPAIMKEGSLRGGVACILDLEIIKAARSQAIVTLLKMRNDFKIGCSTVPQLSTSRLRALLRLGSNDLNNNEVQHAYSDTFFEGGEWAKDTKKQLKWLEKAAANPCPQPNHGAMYHLGCILAAGDDGRGIERDSQRAEALFRAAMAQVTPGSTQWERYHKMFSRVFFQGGLLPESTSGPERVAQSTAGCAMVRSRCNLCGKEPSGAGSSGQQGATTGDSCTLKNCSRCRRVEYCSKECQCAAWPEHKKVCIKAPSQ